MSNDESPVDIAASSAASPETDASTAIEATENVAAPARRRSTTPRAPRKSRKSEPEPTAVETEAPVTEGAPAAADPEPAPEPPKRRRNTRKKGEEPAPETAAEISDTGTIPAAQPAPEPVVPEAPAEETPKTRRRAPRKTKQEAADAAADAAPTPEVEAPVVEMEPAAEEAKPARGRTRRPRGRKAEAEAEAEPLSEPGAEETPDEATVVTADAVDDATDEAEDGTGPELLPAPDFIEITPDSLSDEDSDDGEEADGAATDTAETDTDGERGGRRGRRRRGSRREREGRDRFDSDRRPSEVHRGARVVRGRRGVPELQINGETVAPVLFFGSVDGQKEARRVTSEVQRAASHGIHLHSTLVELPCPIPLDDSVYETLDQHIETILDADPRGYVIPRIVFVPAKGWLKQYPNELSHYAGGRTDDPSIASDLFWLEAEMALRALVEHIGRLSYGERVVGYHLERGEWFHPADGGYDRSYANREGFRLWLRRKYRNNEAQLRGGWYDGQVQFYLTEIPEPPAGERSDVTFFESRRERRWMDFLEYTSEITVDRLVRLSQTIKEASAGRALVSVCYGYTFEFGHTFSGHLALGRLLRTESIDIVSGPPSYKDRQAGGAGSYPGPAHSVAVHGKLWISEDDTKTFLAPGDEPDDFNPRIENRFLTEQVQQRAIGQALAGQTGVAWMDTWGEGWLDAPDMWERIAAFRDRAADSSRLRRGASPEVVVLVDESSLLHVQRGPNFLRRVLAEQREILQRSGASVGFYLQDDVTQPEFPTDAKLYLFLTPYRISPEQRSAISQKLQTQGKTLVWMYAPGVCDTHGEPAETAHEVIGMALRQQPWSSELSTRIIDAHHAVTEGIRGKVVGVRERLNPSFYVEDDTPGITVLGEYQQSGLASIAVRKMQGWNSVFVGEPALSLDLLRGLCRFAGVHLYCDGQDDYVWAGGGWVTIHATRDGQRTIRVPRGAALFDVTENRYYGENPGEARVFIRGRHTHQFFVGSPDEMRDLGFSLDRTARSRRRGEGREDSRDEELEPGEVDAGQDADTQDVEAAASVPPADADAATPINLLPPAPSRRERGRDRNRERPPLIRELPPVEISPEAAALAERLFPLNLLDEPETTAPVAPIAPVVDPVLPSPVPDSEVEDDADEDDDGDEEDNGENGDSEEENGDPDSEAAQRRRRRRRGGRGRGRRRPGDGGAPAAE